SEMWGLAPARLRAKGIPLISIRFPILRTAAFVLGSNRSSMAKGIQTILLRSWKWGRVPDSSRGPKKPEIKNPFTRDGRRGLYYNKLFLNFPTQKTFQALVLKKISGDLNSVLFLGFHGHILDIFHQ